MEPSSLREEAVRNACIVLAAALVAGCAGTSKRTDSLQQTVQNVDSGLVRIAYVSSSDLASDDKGQRYQAAVRFVRDKQCSSGTANPLFLTSLPMNVRLTGNVGSDGRIEFSTDKAQGGSGKGVEVSLRASTLADLPNEYLREMSALLQSKGLPDEVMNRLKREIPGTYQTLTVRINKLVNEFDPNSCGTSARPATAPVVATAPQAVKPAAAPAAAAAPRAQAPKPRQDRSAGIFVPTF
jgi:hypothetical protein